MSFVRHDIRTFLSAAAALEVIIETPEHDLVFGDLTGGAY
jgi:hypothetical protein